MPSRPRGDKEGSRKRAFAFKVHRNGDGHWHLTRVVFKSDAKKQSVFRHEEPFGPKEGYPTEADAEKALWTHLHPEPDPFEGE
jgi:hypothetical protein